MTPCGAALNDGWTVVVDVFFGSCYMSSPLFFSCFFFFFSGVVFRVVVSRFFSVSRGFLRCWDYFVWWIRLVGDLSRVAFFQFFFWKAIPWKKVSSEQVSQDKPSNPYPRKCHYKDAERFQTILVGCKLEACQLLLLPRFYDKESALKSTFTAFLTSFFSSVFFHLFFSCFCFRCFLMFLGFYHRFSPYFETFTVHFPALPCLAPGSCPWAANPWRFGAPQRGVACAPCRGLGELWPVAGAPGWFDSSVGF